MLPLWIIDLRCKSERRDNFASLVGQIDHIAFNKRIESPSISDDVELQKIDVGAIYKVESGDAEMLSASQTENEARLIAAQHAKIVGNYWRYSIIDCDKYSIDFRSASDAANDKVTAEVKADKLKKSAEESANKLYLFQNDLVAEGQQFIKDLRDSNVHPDLKINIVVLGDITEKITRILFASIAGILQKEKGRILPHHIHQGVEIVGMLYIPSDINTLHVDVRKSMQRTLKEIDVQHTINDIRGYDHMMFYQDVQNRTECSYTRLNDRQLAQYLVQCLVNLYFACDESHPLLSGTSSADIFYFSMGATSVHFDTENEDLKNRHELAIEFIRNFKSAGDDEKENKDLNLIDDGDYSPKEIFEEFEVLKKLDCLDVEIENPNPHPVRNFFAKYLKRYYYNLYLRFFTTNLMQKVVAQISVCTRSSLESISTKSKSRFDSIQKRIKESLKEILGQVSANDGGLPKIVDLFKKMQEQLSDRRADIQKVLEQQFWRHIEENHLAKELKDRFMEYHDAYTADIKNKTGGSGQLEMKKQAVIELNGLLSKESTTLSRIGRSVLLGVVLILSMLPILEFLSPGTINLGDVKEYSYFWAAGLFLIPIIIQVVIFFRYNRKKIRAVNNLKAIYLHDAYARIANRIESEINTFYDRAIELGNRYIERCESIRKEVGKDFQSEDENKPLIPVGMFNQPLIGGAFGGIGLLPEIEADDSEISINYIRYKLRELTKIEYYLMINQHRSMLMELFDDVAICENLIRRVKEDGEEELLTKEQQENEQQEAWLKHKQVFYEELRAMTKRSLNPRENKTVGEKLQSYCAAHPEHCDLLAPVIAYAATNGEITSSADLEFVDAKFNEKRVERYITPYITTNCYRMQFDKYDRVYGKYIFISRWRCFEKLNLNRILPNEDFDEKARRQLVYEAEEKAKLEKKNKTQKAVVKIAPNPNVSVNPEERTHYIPYTSSLLLWALCPDDSSAEWFRLFESEFFAEAYADKNIYRKILNQND